MRIGRLIAGTAGAAAVLAGLRTLQRQRSRQPSAPPEQAVMQARAELAGNGITGEAVLVEVEQETQRLVRVQLRVQGDPAVLTPGLHGVHIHERGLCEEGERFQTAGGHFDPGPASNTDPDVNHPFHLGDLPNIRIGADGRGEMEAVTSRITLSDGPLSILSGNGTALMLHGNPDQGIPGETQSGVSGGPRLACGVIRPI